MNDIKNPDVLCINTLRALAVDLIQKANSGHPGLPLGAAPMAFLLWHRYLRCDPAKPDWADRDRFVLSAGHGSSMLYCLLHLAGYDLPWDELVKFRQWGSITPGHPERHMTKGVEATTGPLGQGFANAVGMAMAERFLAGRFNRPGHDIVNHFTYTLLGDGCIMEGLSQEAASLAGHLKLGKLIALYDANDVTLDGPADMAFTEDVGARFAAYGWQVLHIEDGDTDIDAIDNALKQAQDDQGKPSLLVVKTTIGFGAPSKQGTCAAHGSPLGEAEIAAVKSFLGLDPGKTLSVPQGAREHFAAIGRRGAELSARWEEGFAAYAREYPDLADHWRLAMAGELPAGWDADLPSFSAGEKVATRVAGGKTLNAIAAQVPWLLGGDADLSGSTKTAIAGAGAFDGTTGEGRNIHYGVREHAMASIANGMACHGGVRNYTATFFVFSDYMRPCLRLAAMDGLPVTHVWTHDSVAVGEDGPTHQPVEHLMALRTIPGFTVVRPADPNETVEAWRVAMEENDGPIGLVLSRQNVPVLDPEKCAPPHGLRRGAYVLRDSWRGDPDALIIATGAEVHVALEAQDRLAGMGIHTRVVSMPSFELFEAQDQTYRDSVLPPALLARVSLEAGVTIGWHRWVGDGGIALGIDRFGASAPAEIVLDKLGMNPGRVVKAVKSLLD